MGSRTNTRNALRSATRAVALRIVRNEKVGKDALEFFARNPPRHKCMFCGTGGHRRGDPVEGEPGHAYRGGTRA